MTYKRVILTFIVLLLLCGIAYSEELTPKANRYIVLFFDDADKSIAAEYGEVTHEFTIINAVVMNLTKKQAQALRSQEPNVKSVEKDQVISVGSTQEAQPLMKTMDGETQTMDYIPGSQWNLGETGINAEAAWENFNVDGTGVTIAIIDSGVDYNNPDLAFPKYKGGIDYCSEGSGILCNIDKDDEDDDPMDENGHGTESTSIMLGQGNIIKGIAPEAEYYAIKITGSNGEGSLTALVFALDWAATQEDVKIILQDIGYDVMIDSILNNNI